MGEGKDALREEKRRGTPLNPLQLYRIGSAGQPMFTPCHWHPEAEVIFVLEGSLELTVNGGKFSGGPGDVFWVNQGELHGMCTGGGPARYGALVFPPEYLCFEVYDYTQSHYLAPLCRRELRVPTKLPRASAAAAGVWEELCRIEALDRAQAPGCQIAVKASLLRVVSLLVQGGLLRPAGDGSSPCSDGKVRQLKEILAYLDAHYSERLSLADTARAFHFSAKYFSRYFRQNLGSTFVEYLGGLRIGRAADRLLHTGRPVGEIALAAGFDNFSYFIRRFKKVYGCTPSAFRRRAERGPGALPAGAAGDGREPPDLTHGR